ncbi:MAG: 4-(cytidine 5'-diphospho)-2-C-methyl-D-erythritol kinase [Proteobacteria bacterium]|nr:4-(cytidine 5'-diphospho)-2-C-methyl-D-erythritol kinase [Pseudomonadota bacterium]
MERVLARAKVNLYLAVLGKRPDGYHELETAMHPVDLADELVFSEAPAGVVEVFCDAPGIPTDETNLAHRAAALFFREWGEPGGVRVELTKHIPAGAGLGGGSSDAAAVLNWLNARHGNPFSREKLEALGAALGADVPFFVRGKPAWATGRGEILSPLPLIFPYELVLVFPGVFSSTARAYERLTLTLTTREKALRVADLKSTPRSMEAFLRNDLEGAVLPYLPQVGEAKAAILSAGAAGALMSGSGSAVFGLFETAGEADRAALLVAEKDSSWTVFRTRLQAEGMVTRHGPFPPEAETGP